MIRGLKNLLVNMKKKATGIAHPKAKFFEYEKQFLVLPNCRDKSLVEQYSQGNLQKIEKRLVEYYRELEKDLNFRVSEKKSYVYVRVSDGEAYFLKGRLVGNGPKRHYTKNSVIDSNYLKQFKKGLLDCDSRHIEMYKNNRREFLKIYGRNIFSAIPFECIYALIASRNIFSLPYNIGLIGSGPKLDVIRQLLEFPEYRKYLGRENFQDFISIPERGSSNDVQNLTQNIQNQLNPNVDIYLVGIGIAKLAVLPKLKEHSKAVFVDVGAGISALAGMINTNRPYFADWINYRLRDFNYSGIDQMDFTTVEPGVVYL